MTASQKLFHSLPGLPGDGPAPVQFSATGQGMHREGFVVTFHPTSGCPWVGNFQPGLSNYSAALLHPDGRSVIVISGGQAYHIDPDTRALLGEFGCSITASIFDSHRSLYIFSDPTHLWALGPSGVRWQTGRISWGGIRSLAIEGDHITGEAYDPISRVWTPFKVHVESGIVDGSSLTSIQSDQ